VAKWLIGILVSSVVMSLILKVLPENSIKKSVHIAFGIIFLLVTAVPLLNMFSEGFEIGGTSAFLKSKVEAVSNDSDDKYIESVISEYSDSLEILAEETLLEENGAECDVTVSVCKEKDSSLFGNVLNVKCLVRKTGVDLGDDKSDSIISDIPLVEDIVISFSRENSENDFDSGPLQETLSRLFGISAEQCEIYTEGE